MLDLLIIGGAAAGSTAAISAARAELNFKLVSLDWGGEVSRSGEVLNYTGIPETDGIKLADVFREHVDENKVNIELPVEVVSIEKKADLTFEIKAKKSGEDVIYQAKSIIITTGVHPRELGVKGEKELKNKGLSYCTVCDGPLYKNKEVVIAGGGNSGLESALMMANIESKVTLLSKYDELKGESVYIKKVTNDKRINIIYNVLPTEVLGENSVTGVAYENRDTKELGEVNAQGMFVHIGFTPNTGFLPNIDKNKAGEIIVDADMNTNLKGVFAAGDVTNVSYKQIIISAGQGAIAALSVVKYLNQLEG
jgi:alkyl hydroperoxide reductase subunit AhpF